MSHKFILDILKNVAILQDVPDGQLQWLIKKGEIIVLEKDDHLLKKDNPLNHMYIILSGNLMLKSEQAESFRTVGELDEGSISGSLPYSRAKNSAYYAVALRRSKVLAVNKKHFPEMIKTQFELTEALVHFMATRIREFTKFQQQNEKMMALGKLSAGLAHELNNPSAAVLRSSKYLKNHLGSLQEKFMEVVNIGITDEEIDRVKTIVFQQIKNNNSPALSLADRTEKEEELLKFLNEKQVDNSEEISENFAGFNFTRDKIEKIAGELVDDHLSPILNWFNKIILMHRLIEEIGNASQKINDLVISVKTYTHMDQSPEKQQVDIHAAIDNTLKIMQHKIRKLDILVEKEYQPNLPQPYLKPTEFNQIWSNLIDNAIDALEDAEKKKLKIKTVKEGDYIKVNIIDSGKGISDKHKDKIYDPFFTTKAVDKGTGLGLDIVKQVIQQHNGSITVNSIPGKTDFEVCIPIK